MPRSALTLAVLMRESTDCVEAALHAPEPERHGVASRILEDPAAWRRWEEEHARLMREVVVQGRFDRQVLGLRQTSLRLIHSKAPFEFLRDQAVRGDERRRVLVHLHPSRNFTEALISEHGTFLRASCSYFCSHHLGTEVASDSVFLSAMQRYEQLYSEYFRVYCDSFRVAASIDAESQLALLPFLKHQVNEQRRRILGMPRSTPELEREERLRERTGDTQKLAVRELRRKLSR